jgi:hypothetical protein
MIYAVLESGDSLVHELALAVRVDFGGWLAYTAPLLWILPLDTARYRWLERRDFASERIPVRATGRPKHPE